MCKSFHAKVRYGAGKTGIWNTLAVILAIGAVQTAMADDGILVTRSKVPARVVSLKDLNLANSADQEILYHRVRSASIEVCRSPISSQWDPSADSRCRQDTYRAAMSKVSDQLAALGVIGAAQTLANLEVKPERK